MLNIIFACNLKDPMSTVVQNRIKKDLIKDHNFSCIDINDHPFYIDELQLQFNQTLIIKDNEEELSRLEGPFDELQLSKAISDSIQFLEGRFQL
ncbi:hypothetical protein [Staphylococcus equorum]|uniref:Uncharacterized protein n=1 Tax=Staphylococcus equorum TaxID=246432 RepID=A0A9X4R2L6_9STAP|nr:hypothetical protein [Staphylococcus equorum]MDG0860355.1 hypothetical protein [Staphylococcus equorum]